MKVHKDKLRHAIPNGDVRGQRNDMFPSSAPFIYHIKQLTPSPYAPCPSVCLHRDMGHCIDLTPRCIVRVTIIIAITYTAVAIEARVHQTHSGTVCRE